MRTYRVTIRGRFAALRGLVFRCETRLDDIKVRRRKTRGSGRG